MKDTMTPKPPPYLPPTRGLRVLTFFCRPTGSQSIAYRPTVCSSCVCFVTRKQRVDECGAVRILGMPCSALQGQKESDGMRLQGFFVSACPIPSH